MSYYIDYAIEGIDYQNNIGNIAILGSKGHGKTTLINTLSYYNGFYDKNEKNKFINSKGVSLFCELYNDDFQNFQKFLINVIDTPGQIDFSSEIRSSFRITDGALFVVNYYEGINTFKKLF